MAQVVDPIHETRPFLGLAPEGWRVIIPLWILTCGVWALLAWLVGAFWSGLVLVPILVIGTSFFRDPKRQIPEGQDLVIAPADGVVVAIQEVSEGPYVTTPHQRVSIFMSPLNVHVNRVPVAGQVEKVVYHRGKFHMAKVDKASLDNEQNGVYIRNEKGTVVFVQIAGWLARRIICHLKGGEQVARGTRFGLICFGSRVDIYLPRASQVLVGIGQKTKAGESVIAKL